MVDGQKKKERKALGTTFRTDVSDCSPLSSANLGASVILVILGKNPFKNDETENGRGEKRCMEVTKKV